MLIKMNDILAAANAKVAEYMAAGYMISFGDSSFGYKFRVDLEKNGEYVRVKVDDKYGYGEQASSLILSVVAIPDAEDFEPKGAEPIYIKTWYCVNEYRRGEHIYTESMAEIKEIAHKHVERHHAKYSYTPAPALVPSAALIRALKQRKGFTNATRNNISVRRVEAGYEISLKARDGHVSRTETIKFPGKSV